jgi:hypothetical protein
MSSSRKIYLAALLTEAVRVLREAAPPAPPPPVPAAGAVPPSPVPPAPATNASAAAPPVDPNAPPPSAGAEPPKPFDVDAMIDRLNVIRGGKSFADPEVYGQLTAYFKTMSDADKAVVDNFLQSIGKIVIQVDSAQQSGAAGAQPPMNQAPAPVAPAPAPGAAPPAGV